MIFEDRHDAGQQLGKKLFTQYAKKDVVVYALPRGGVVLGADIASILHAPLELVIPRKIGHPLNAEYAIAAVTEHGNIVEHTNEVRDVDPAWFRDAVQNEIKEAQRRRITYCGDRAPTSSRNMIAIIVDDGIATGLTMRAAIVDIKKQKPAKIIIAVPVAPFDVVRYLKKDVDGVVALHTPEDYAGAVGAYYKNFDQVRDTEVINLIKQSSHPALRN